MNINIFIPFRSKIAEDSSNDMHDIVNAMHNCLFLRTQHSRGQHTFLKCKSTSVLLCDLHEEHGL